MKFVAIAMPLDIPADEAKNHILRTVIEADGVRGAYVAVLVQGCSFTEGQAQAAGITATYDFDASVGNGIAGEYGIVVFPESLEKLMLRNHTAVLATLNMVPGTEQLFHP